MSVYETIHVGELRKVYTIYEREGGLQAALKGVFRRKTREMVAVDDLSFSLEAGEMVGFLGPNGAGKTTTLKMLSGLLYPSAGEVRVLGYQPWKREKSYLRQIALVMGQRNQLVWDIPALDSFELNRVIYQIPLSEYQAMLKEITDLLELGPLLRKPVRNLSLGERMKCEIAASLLHKPRILFLDEPTIGLDVVMQRRIRQFLAEYNRRFEANILLTSHYMADVEALCKRVIIIHHGHMLFDGALSELVSRFSPYKKVVVTVGDVNNVQMQSYGVVEDGKMILHVLKDEIARVTSRLLSDLPVQDISIEDMSIDAVIEQVFSQEVSHEASV